MPNSLARSEPCRLVLRKETGKTVSTVTLRRALKKDFSFKRIRHSLKVLRDEADFWNTQGLLKTLYQQEDQGEHELYYFDESGFSQASSVPYPWSPAVIFNPVVQMAALKQPFYYARFPALSLG